MIKEFKELVVLAIATILFLCASFDIAEPDLAQRSAGTDGYRRPLKRSS